MVKYLPVRGWFLILLVLLGTLVAVVAWGAYGGVVSKPGQLMEQGRGLQPTDPRARVNATRALYPDLASGRNEIRLSGGMFTIQPVGLRDSWYVGEYTRAEGSPQRSTLAGALSGREPGGPTHSLGVSQDQLYARTVQALTVWWARRTLTDAWDIGLSPGLDWSLDLSLGGSAADMDLRGITLDDLTLKLVRSEADLYLGDNGDSASVDMLLVGSNVTLHLPDEQPARIRTGGLLLTVDVSESWRRDGDSYYSPSYTGASDYTQIRIHSILGRVTVSSIVR